MSIIWPRTSYLHNMLSTIQLMHNIDHFTFFMFILLCCFYWNIERFLNLKVRMLFRTPCGIKKKKCLFYNKFFTLKLWYVKTEFKLLVSIHLINLSGNTLGFRSVVGIETGSWNHHKELSSIYNIFWNSPLLL